MLSEAEKIISLDSDILFFKNPDQLINWFSTEKNFIYSQSDNQNLIQKNILEETGCRLSESEPFLNNGFLGFPRQTLNLPNIEEALKEVIKACKNLENTHSFFEKKIWVLGENTLALLVKKRLFSEDNYKVETFDKQLYQGGIKNFYPDPVSRHYYTISSRFGDSTMDTYIADAQKIIAQIFLA
jgi:lipopolysaccharide biosynthesis glycosyltransferase